MDKVVNTSISNELRDFCTRSREFRKTLHDKNRGLSSQDNTKHLQAVFAMLNIASEHGIAIHVLAENLCFTPAIGLLRMQYEAILKASWLYWVAEEEIIGNLSIDSNNILEKDKTYPQIGEILSQLENKNKFIYDILKEFDDNYKFTCSYIHSGKIALDSKIKGIDEETITTVIRNSNSLEVVGNAILAVLLNSEDIAEHVRNTQLEYSDCLPFSLKK